MQPKEVIESNPICNHHGENRRVTESKCMIKAQADRLVRSLEKLMTAAMELLVTASCSKTMISLGKIIKNSIKYAVLQLLNVSYLAPRIHNALMDT